MTRTRTIRFRIPFRFPLAGGEAAAVAPVLIRCVWLALLILSAASARAGAQADGLRREKLTVGFRERAFLGVNRADAEAAFKVFSRSVALNRGYEIEATVRTFASVSDLREAVSSGSVNLGIRWLEDVLEALAQSSTGRTAAHKVVPPTKP